MPNPTKGNFLNELGSRFGELKKLPNSLSLFDVPSLQCRVYVRYSKVHSRHQTFYGLRTTDLAQLEGLNAVICFLWDGQKEPLILPYAEFSEILTPLVPAHDGQIKAQVFLGDDATDLYFSNAGRFNVESFLGWNNLELFLDRSRINEIPALSHAQVQTLLGAIGIARGHDIWIPQNDRKRLDWQMTDAFNFRNELPERYDRVLPTIKNVDVLWIKRGSSDIAGMFEVEHSTSIYSGLLRFNDLHLTQPDMRPRFSIVSNDVRRALFLRQIARPTFKFSGLSDLCTFLDYKDVYGWFKRAVGSVMK